MRKLKMILIILTGLFQVAALVCFFMSIVLAIYLFAFHILFFILLIVVLVMERIKEKREEDDDDYRNY